MKKITLLIGLALLFGFGGMAQKNRVLPNGLATQKNIATQNMQSKHSPNANSFAKIKHQSPVVDISKGLKSSKGLIQVLILTPDYAFTAPIVTGLSAYPDLQITVYDTTNFGTFSVTDLLPYDVVFAYNDYTWESAGGDRTVVGDVLKDYLDAGGKVVENEFLKSFDNWGLAGGYVTGNYSAFGTTTTDTYTATALGTILNPTHPILTGVTTLTSTFDDQDPTLAAGAEEIADWADGYIAIAAKPNVVSINMIPYDPNGGVTGFTGDGFVLYHNAIVWLAGAPIAHCDISPLLLTAPLNSDYLTVSDSIRVKVANNDSIGHINIPITYVIDGGTPYTDMITDSIPGQDYIIFTFQQPYDFSIPAHIYDVEIYTDFSCDTVNDNDTLYTTVYNDYDAAAISIDMLPIIGVGTTNPLATVRNMGSVGITFDVTMNIGAYTSVQATTLAPGASQQITFDPWTAALGNYSIEVYTMLSNDMDMTNDTLRQNISVQNLIKAYCYVAYDPSGVIPAGPAFTYLQDPSTIIPLADQSAENFVAAGTWGAGNRWYGAVYSDNTLITLDTLTGVRTVIGNSGVGLSGMAFDYTTNNIYGVDWNATSSTSSLYRINSINGAATLIGTSSTDLLINLACDTFGNLYSLGITNDLLYSIDKNTGVATSIGSIGFDASYAQDMEFDHYTNTCYLAAYNVTTSAGELSIINTTTGAATLIGAFAGGAEITGFAIPYTSDDIITDAGIAAVVSPSNDTTCVLSSSEYVTVSIANFGNDSISNFDVSYQINSGPIVTETVTDTLLPYGMLSHTFATAEDMSAYGSYIIKAYTTVVGDTFNTNDTIIKTVISADATVTVNIMTDSYGSETTWELINNTTSQVVATGGPYLANTYYSTNVCVLSSDCFTFNIYDAFGDGMCCSYGNGTYEVIWGNSYGVIPGSFTTSATITNICVPLPIDAGVVSIISPSNNTACALSTTENVTVNIKNFGSDTLSDFDVSYQINSGTVVTETITDTIVPFDTLLYTFTNTADLSTYGTYVVESYTTVTGDGNHANDSASTSVISADATITVNIQTDSYGSETTWELINNTTSQVVATGGPYAASTYYTTNVCALTSDCFTFNIYDSFGDGMCCAYGNGTYEIQWDGLSFGVIPGQFTTSAQITNICQPQPNDVGSLSIDFSGGLPGTIIPMGTVKNFGTLTQTFDATLLITPGGYTSTQTVTSLASGASQQLTFTPNWNPAVGVYTATLYTTLPGGDAYSFNDTVVKTINIVEVVNKAYCYIAYDPTTALPEGPAILDLDNPTTIISLADQTGQNFVAGGAWANDHWYGAVYTDNTLIDIDTITGARTVIGPLGYAIYGLTYNTIDDILYGTDGVSLYKIDIATGAATLIGDMGISGSTFINLACNNVTDTLYSVNITDDILYSVNKASGAATAVGAIGFDASYAQGMEFHPDGTCYMAAYNVTSGSGELRKVDIATGTTALIGAFPGGAEIDALAIPDNLVTSIAEVSVKAVVNVFPNPAKDILNVIASQNIKNVRITNAFGQLVLSSTVNGSNTVISTSELSDGVYYLQIETADGITIKKISVIK
jgi:hypothetical protein